MKKILIVLVALVIALIACDVEVSVNVGEPSASASDSLKKTGIEPRNYTDEDGCEYLVFVDSGVSGLGVGVAPKVIQPEVCAEKIKN